jgi:hypothetical protein
MAVILKIIWRVAPAPCGRRLGVSAKRSMSGHHPQNGRESWAEDAKPDKNDCRTGKRISTSCRQNRRGLRHIAIKEHRHLMFKMTGRARAKGLQFRWQLFNLDGSEIRRGRDHRH